MPEEHSIAVRLVALANVVDPLGRPDLDCSARVRELLRELRAQFRRVAGSEPDAEQVDIGLPMRA
jgi:hypothetical protein